MAETLDMDGLDKLTLAWLLAARKSPTKQGLARAVEPFVRGSGASAESIARQCLARLKARGDIEADTTWMLSPAGKAKALAALAVTETELPKRLTWKWLHALLVLRGLGVGLSDKSHARAATAEGLPAVLLQRDYAIESSSLLSLSQVGNAIAWRALGVESTAPFTLNAVLTHILRQTKPQAAKPKDARDATRALAAARFGIANGDAPLRAALVRRWMRADPAERAPTPPPAREPSRGARVHLALQDFAARVLAAARAAETGRWGENKVFISHAWKELQRRGEAMERDLPAFKEKLARANQAGLLSLSGADLVEVMDPSDLADSAIAAVGTTFHFVVTH